jgi:hypothetical protein
MHYVLFLVYNPIQLKTHGLYLRVSSPLVLGGVHKNIPLCPNTSAWLPCSKLPNNSKPIFRYWARLAIVEQERRVLRKLKY